MSNPPKPSADYAGATRLGREPAPRRRKKVATQKGKKKGKKKAKQSKR